MKKRDGQLRLSRMAEALTHDKNQRNFWSEVKKIEGKSKVRPPHIDGAVDAEDTSNVFTTKYKTLYNSVPSAAHEMKNINDELEIMLKDYMPDNESIHIITVDDVVKARQKLKADKTDVSKGLWSNHMLLMLLMCICRWR